MSKDFEGLLQSAFPRSTWSRIVRGQQEGLALADDVRVNTPFLNNLLGRDLRGHLRRIGVMFRLEQLCKTGHLPFDAEIGRMPDGNWHWLNLRSGSFIAHIARTETLTEIPDDTPNRQHYLAKNEFDLFDGKVVPIDELKRRVDRFYAYLTFGAGYEGKLTHSGLGMVSSSNDDWLVLMNLLRPSGESFDDTPDPSPKFDPKDRIKFHQHIEEWLAPDRDRTDKDQE